MNTSNLLARILGIVLANLINVLSTSAYAQSASHVTTSRASDSTQIVGLVESMLSAWNTHDMYAFANLFHKDAVFVLWNSEVLQGRDSIEAGHVQVHKTFLRKNVRKERIDEIKFVGPDVAVLRTYDNLTGDERYPGKVTESRKLFVCTKRDNVWRIAWGQTTRTPEFSTVK